MNKRKLIFLFLIINTLSAFSHDYGSWIQTDSLKYARNEHASVALLNGDILVCGGNGLQDKLKSCEIFDCQLKKWIVVDSMNIARHGHKSVLLNDGRVLVIGGKKTKTCEIFDPVERQWNITDSLLKTHGMNFTADILPTGKVLVVGGLALSNDFSSSYYYRSCEMFDPASEKWEFTDSLQTGRSSHTSTVLNDGKVLIAGGVNRGNELKSCEIFDPLLEQWEVADSLNYARYDHSSVILPDGNILISGGLNNDNLTFPWLHSCELYNMRIHEWIQVNPLNIPHSRHNTIMINDSTLLITGGNFNDNYWELYNVNNLTSDYVEYYQFVKQNQSSHLLSDGTVLNIGGISWIDGTPPSIFPTNMCEIYNPFISSIQTNNCNCFDNFILEQNYPNPFNSTSVISFNLPRSCKVMLKIYNLKGQEIETLINGLIEKGYHSCLFSLDNLQSGVFLYSLIIDKNVFTRKMLLIQ